MVVHCGFNSGKTLSVATTHWSWLLTLNRVSFSLSTLVSAESLLMTPSWKSWVKDSLGQFLLVSLTPVRITRSKDEWHVVTYLFSHTCVTHYPGFVTLFYLYWQLYEEIQLKCSSNKFSYDEILACDYLDQCVKETMRLYTPVSRYDIPISCDLYTDVMWLICRCHVTYIPMSCDLCTDVMWLIYRCHVTYIPMLRDLYTDVMWLIYRCHVTYIPMSCDLYTDVM